MVVMYCVALGMGLLSSYFARTTGKVLKYPYKEWGHLHTVQDGQGGPTAWACDAKYEIVDAQFGGIGV